jgi:hypothetical protein
MSGASDTPTAKIQRTGHGWDRTIGRRPTSGAARNVGLCRPACRDLSEFGGANNVFCCVDYGRSSPTRAGPSSSARSPGWWSTGRGLNTRLLVDRQHEAVGSRYGTSVIPGGGNSRPHPGAAVISLRAGGYMALLQLALSSPQWSLAAPGGDSPTFLYRAVSFDLNSAAVLLLAKFCGSIRRSPKSSPSFPFSNWHYLG